MAVVSLSFEATGLEKASGSIRSISGDLSKLGKAANDAGRVATSSLGRIGRALTGLSVRAAAAGRVMVRVGQDISRVGTKLILGLTLPIALAGAALLKFAANAVESENLFEVAMGDMAASSRKFSEKLSRDLGLNAFTVRKNIGTFFQMTTAMGVSREAALDMSQALTLLTEDMASFFNLKSDVAFLKIQAAISGEVEPLKRLGVVVNETTIKNLAMTEGILKQGQVLSEAQKVLLRTVVILRQTAVAQGDLARTIDSPTNQMRIMRARAENLAIELGTALLPALVSLLGVLSLMISPIRDAINWFKDLTDAQKGMLIMTIALAAALGPLLKIIGLLIAATGFFLPILTTIVTAVAAAATVFAAWVLSIVPLVLEIAAIGAVIGVVIGAIVLLIRAGSNLQVLWATIWRKIARAALEAAFSIAQALDGAIAKFLGLDDDLDAVRAKILGLIDKNVAAEIASGVDTIGQAFDNLTSGVIDDIVGAKDAISSGFSEMADDVGAMGTRMVGDIVRTKDAILEAFSSVFTFIGEQTTVSTEEFDKIYAEAERKALEFAKKLSESTSTAAGQKAVAQLQVKYDQLRGALDPTVAASFRMLESLRLLDQALDSGVIPTVREYEELQRAVIKNYDDEIVKIEERLATHQSAEEAIRQQLTDTSFKALSVAQSIHSGMTSAFKGILTGATSLGEGLKSIFAGMVDAILAELARIATSAFFSLVLSFIGGAIGGPAGAAVGGSFGGAIGGGPSGRFQTGGRRIVTRPQLIAVGEMGPELVSVRPLAGGARGATGGITVILQSEMFIGDEVTIRNTGRRLARLISAETGARRL
jgi:hypothetical protein